jgi:hypothetical protein
MYALFQDSWLALLSRRFQEDRAENKESNKELRNMREGVVVANLRYYPNTCGECTEESHESLLAEIQPGAGRKHNL